MSRLLEEVVVSHVEKSVAAKKGSRGDVYHAQKMLEESIVKEIVSEYIEEVNFEIRRQEKERAAVRELDEFKKLLFQCVILALVVGVLGSHIYGLLEALFYQPDSGIRRWSLIIGLIILFIVTTILLYQEYISKMFSALKRFNKAHKELANED